VVPESKEGLNVPVDSERFDNVATDEGARVTITEYVLVVVPSEAVTTTVIVFAPTLNEMAPDAEPDDVVVPFTVTVAVSLVTVGVTVTDDVAFDTDAV
jgi:hypothetical protein